MLVQRTIEQDTPITNISPIRSAETLPLSAALDCQTMTAYLQAQSPQSMLVGELCADVHCDQGITVQRCELLDCKPGKRALIRYHVALPQHDRRVEIFGKIYSDERQLTRITQVMNDLWYDLFHDRTRRGTERCGIPQPVGTIPELSMHLYIPAGGEFLDTVLTRAEGVQAIQHTARWLSTLHQHSLQLTKRFDLANEVTNLATWAELVGQHHPALATSAQQLFDGLEQLAQEIVLETATPIHKDFHYRHVLCDNVRPVQLNENSVSHHNRSIVTESYTGGRINVIDFDEIRLGDRNFDLAHFCANLHLLAYRQQGTPHSFEKLEAYFLRTYAYHIGQTWATFAHKNRQRFRFFYAYSCIKIARQLTLGFGPSPVPSGTDRYRQIQMILKQGNQQ